MVTSKRTENLVTEILARQHKILSDVKATQGGTDLAPDPHEILEAALAACTTITLQMYANFKKIPLRSANVEVIVDQESKEASHITRKINLEGDLTPEQKTRLIEIANKCPIHKLLSSKITISTSES